MIISCNILDVLECLFEFDNARTRYGLQYVIQGYKVLELSSLILKDLILVHIY